MFHCWLEKWSHTRVVSQHTGNLTQVLHEWVPYRVCHEPMRFKLLKAALLVCYLLTTILHSVQNRGYLLSIMAVLFSLWQMQGGVIVLCFNLVSITINRTRHGTELPLLVPPTFATQNHGPTKLRASGLCRGRILITGATHTMQRHHGGSWQRKTDCALYTDSHLPY